MSGDATDTRRRLAAISHHFLSGPMPGAAGMEKGTLVLPVLPVGPCPSFPFDLLTQAVQSKGRSVHVLEFERGLQDAPHHQPSAAPRPDPPTPSAPVGGGGGPAFSDQVATALSALSVAPALCFVPLKKGEWPVAAALGNVLLQVNAGKDDVVSAYTVIKRMAAAGMKGMIGVTLCGTRGTAEATRYFDQLAEAADRFMGVTVISYGHVPAPPPSHAPVDLLAEDGPDTSRIRAVYGIASLLLEDLPETPPATGVTAKGRPSEGEA